MCEHRGQPLCTQMAEVGFSGTVVTHGCEPPCGWWELNSGGLQEQSEFPEAEPVPILGLPF